jgi:hypothetical protein
MTRGHYVIPVYRALTIVNSALRHDVIGGLVLVPVVTTTLSFPVGVNYEMRPFAAASAHAAVSLSAYPKRSERR